MRENGNCRVLEFESPRVAGSVNYLHRLLAMKPNPLASSTGWIQWLTQWSATAMQSVALDVVAFCLLSFLGHSLWRNYVVRRPGQPCGSTHLAMD